jgi:NAD(P)-dependent dehydrogenase (short-subunit alcohol dehydrogenase family)
MSSLPGLFDLTGRSALVTGATGAFGSMTAHTLAEAGASLTIAGGSGDKLDMLAQELTDCGHNVTAVKRRPDCEEAVQEMVDAAVTSTGSLDLVVTASGINKIGAAIEQPVADWDAVVDANAKGTWLVCRAAARWMIGKQSPGKFVLVSSTRSELGHPAGYAAYCSSKAAVNLLTKSLACEWGRYRINVNAIAPTVFRSDLTEWMYSDEDPGKSVREGFLQRIPLGRLGEPDDFRGALLYFLSSASDFCTGQVLYVDGGYTAG